MESCNGKGRGAAGGEVWRRVFEEHAAGLGTAADLCARHGVAKGSWYYWKCRLGSAAGEARPAGAARFAELVVCAEPSGAGAVRGGSAVEVILPSGALVRVGPGAGEAELAMVLRVLCQC